MIACSTYGAIPVSLKTTKASVRLNGEGAGAEAEYWIDKVLLRIRSSGTRSYLVTLVSASSGQKWHPDAYMSVFWYAMNA